MNPSVDNSYSDWDIEPTPNFNSDQHLEISKRRPETKYDSGGIVTVWSNALESDIVELNRANLEAGKMPWTIVGY